MKGGAPGRCRRRRRRRVSDSASELPGQWSARRRFPVTYPPFPPLRTRALSLTWQAGGGGRPGSEVLSKRLLGPAPRTHPAREARPRPSSGGPGGGPGQPGPAQDSPRFPRDERRPSPPPTGGDVGGDPLYLPRRVPRGACPVPRRPKRLPAPSLRASARRSSRYARDKVSSSRRVRGTRTWYNRFGS